MPRPAIRPAIRPATRADLATLCALGAATFRATYRPISDPDEVEAHIALNFTPEQVAPWLEQPATRTLLATLDGRAVGYAHVRRSPVPDCVTDRNAVELYKLYLLADAHGRGIGTALMAAAQAAMRDLGGSSAWLGVYERNLKAIAFYAACGFKRVGTHDFSFGGRVYADPVLARPLAQPGAATDAHGR